MPCWYALTSTVVLSPQEFAATSDTWLPRERGRIPTGGESAPWVSAQVAGPAETGPPDARARLAAARRSRQKHELTHRKCPRNPFDASARNAREGVGLSSSRNGREEAA